MMKDSLVMMKREGMSDDTFSASRMSPPRSMRGEGEDKERKLMMKSKVTWAQRVVFAILALCLTGLTVSAQQTAPPAGKNSPQIESELRSGGNFHSSFASSEFALEGRTIVQGAPFSAVGTKESTQILSDGRSITRRMTMSIYRDRDGRTRHDWGDETKSGAPGRAPMIYDAVTGDTYIFNIRDRRALQFPRQFKGGRSQQAKVITPQSPPDDITQVLGETIEPLGTQTIEGVKAEGVRVTTTIPPKVVGSGQQSNKAIYERWYSQELRRNVLIKSIDPRFGEAIYKLTNIDRDEPARELFQIPADFKKGPLMDREQDAPASFKLERGGRVAVDNRTTGRITIIGEERDTVEATATSERGVERVRFDDKEMPGKYIWLKADYRRDPDESILATLAEVFGGDGGEEPPMRDKQPIEVHLEVRVPRYAEIELIKVIRSRVEVTNVQTPVIVLGDKSEVVLKQVREAEVRTRSGAVEIEDAAGLVEVVTTSGPVRVRRAGADVRVLSISGNVEVECVRGRVNVDSADGLVTLNNVQGDVEANASNSRVLFTGAIREDGRYHLKTMSGSVEMAVRGKPPGFTAALSSYRGTIENDFQLQLKQTSEQHPDASINRRVIGRHGDGQAQITLDSFDGKVKLSKVSGSELKECRLPESKIEK
jgi:hypothetical protein